MEKRSVKRYRSNTQQKTKVDNSRNKYFYIKANISLGLVIVAMVGSHLDRSWSNNAIDRMKSAITTNTSVDKVKSNIDFFRNFTTNKNGISAFAEDNQADVKLDEEIINKINSEGNLYYNNQKK